MHRSRLFSLRKVVDVLLRTGFFGMMAYEAWTIIYKSHTQNWAMLSLAYILLISSVVTPSFMIYYFIKQHLSADPHGIEGASPMAGNALAFTTANFQKEVLEADVPVLVDFWAPWCGPCRIVGPTIEELAAENPGTFKVGKVNVDEHGDVAMTYNVSSIPALMIFKKGKLFQQLIGVQPKARLQQALAEAKD
jgi:thioredoxin 1